VPAWEVETLLIASGEPGRMYALMKDSAGPLWASPATDVRLRISDDWAATWTDFPGGLPVPSECMVNVNLDYASTDALYASTCQGLFVWEGNSWAPRSAELTNVIAVTYGQPDIVWAAEIGDGVVRSDDGGRTWHAADTGLVTFGGMANLGIDPRDNRTLYGMIRPQYAGSYLRRGTSEGNWVTLPTPQDNATIETGMAIDGGSGALYVTTQVPPSALWVSSNANAVDPADVRWAKIVDFDATARVNLLAAGWSPQGTALYANIWPEWYAGPSASGVLNRSLDGGETWEALPMP
jgi:BNR/Asp-box repeat